MVVNQHPRLSPSLYDQYHNIAEFKAEFHRVYVKARKDLMETWNALPYLVTEDVLLETIQHWSVEWMTPTIEDIETKKDTAPDAGPSGKDKGKYAEETEPEQELGTEDPLSDEEEEEESRS